MVALEVDLLWGLKTRVLIHGNYELEMNKLVVTILECVVKVRLKVSLLRGLAVHYFIDFI